MKPIRVRELAQRPEQGTALSLLPHVWIMKNTRLRDSHVLITRTDMPRADIQ